jgi:hypothetical protein
MVKISGSEQVESFEAFPLAPGASVKLICSTFNDAKYQSHLNNLGTVIWNILLLPMLKIVQLI